MFPLILLVLVGVNSTISDSFCIRDTNTYVWLPGKLTTYILPVIEIEDIIRKLSKIVDDLTSVNATPANVDAASKLLKQISNWKTVLFNYRAHNDEKTALFSADQKLFNSMSAAFNDFQDETHGEMSFFDNDRLGPLLDSVNSYSNLKLNADQKQILNEWQRLINAYASTAKECTLFVEIVGSTITSVKNKLCDEFTGNKWKNFWQAINGACDVSSPDFKNSLSDGTFLQSFCKSKGTSMGNDIPGGLSNSPDDNSVFGFLKDDKKY